VTLPTHDGIAAREIAAIERAESRVDDQDERLVIHCRRAGQAADEKRLRGKKGDKNLRQ
jgi:hypothetical protein